MASELNPQERLDWLRLIRSENVGPITFNQLLQHYGTAAAALAALPELARRGGRRDFKVASRQDAERELAAVQGLGARLVAWGEPEYPPALAAVEDAPPLITLRGHAPLLQKRCIAMVGARNASAAGQRFARELAWELGRKGLTVVSGLARGIDAAAHGGALDSGTVAVVAGGVDVVYPEENRTLYDEITERGCIVAEMPVGTEPRARHFPRRNRLIAGISAGVLVVEAALRSGSLITARLAGEQGRDVLAVPGSPLDPRCRGTNDLIRNGAALVETADDVLAVIGRGSEALGEDRRRRFAASTAATPDDAVLDAARDTLEGLLGATPVAIDELIRLSSLPAGLVALVLIELELSGRLDRHAGGRVARR